MTRDTGSTVPRRQIGRVLRELRTEARMTLDGVAAALRCSPGKMWRIEAGLGATRGIDVKALCALYDAAPELTAALLALARETGARGWWHSYDDDTASGRLAFEPYTGLESAASQIRRFGDSLIPDLLQTRSYALAICQRRSTLPSERRSRLAEECLQRQSLLRRRLPRPPRVEVILAEAALLRTVGDAAIMVEQLRHLLSVGETPNVSVRVLPLAAKLHRGAETGSFVILDFPLANRTTPEPPVVYCQSWTGALYLDRPEEYAAYEEVWADLDDLTVGEKASRQLIDTIITEVQQR